MSVFLFSLKRKTQLFVFLMLILSFNSCNSDRSSIYKLLEKYTKQKVRNPNSVIIHDYNVYNSIKYPEKIPMYCLVTNSKKITDSTCSINFLFSAKNQQGTKVFRLVHCYFDSTFKIIKSTYPENIDIENGNLSGTCKYVVGNMKTNRGLSGYQKSGQITIINIDTLCGNKQYHTEIFNGAFVIKDIIPGNYLIKTISHDINFENIYETTVNKNYFILLSIRGIIETYKNCFMETYGLSDPTLFNQTASFVEILNLNGFENSIIPDSNILFIWNNFKKSVSNKFIQDFDITNDYNFLVKFDKIRVEPSEITTFNIDISKFWF